MENIKYQLAMGQMLVQGGEIEQNLSRAKQMIMKAAAQDCRILVLPECLDIGWTYPEAKQLAQPIPGKYSDALCEIAREKSIYVVAGLTERSGEKIYNSAIFISPNGELLLKHRKINLLSIEQNLYSTGDSLSVVETLLGVIGVNICADNFENSLVFGHSLARMGARIILSPSAWAIDVERDSEKESCTKNWKESYKTLAKLYDITVVGVSNVGWINAGVWKGKKCIGCSLAIGPGGNILAEGPYGESAESLVVVSIEIIPTNITGTNIAEMLKNRGYNGP